MINPPFLKLYRQILKPGGKVHFKTDNLELFLYALEVFVAEGNIRFHQLNFDLHSTELANTEVGTKTAYEKKFMALNIKINYVCFSFTDK
jgi:tRNA (guanine-N7-)-methyltransferase